MQLTRSQRIQLSGLADAFANDRQGYDTATSVLKQYGATFPSGYQFWAMARQESWMIKQLRELAAG